VEHTHPDRDSQRERQRYRETETGREGERDRENLSLSLSLSVGSTFYSLSCSFLVLENLSQISAMVTLSLSLSLLTCRSPMHDRTDP
jgi:hypothetical protein